MESDPLAESTGPESVSSYFAAVDLGSNSFHLIVARYSHGQLVIVDRLREMVQLRMGLDKKNHLASDVRQRALDCLSRFGERLRYIPASQLRVVGTNTLRKLRDKGSFLAEAEIALGHSIDVISGIEEARLVYLGALTSMPLEDARSLVVDIGGGSTEIIIGHGSRPLALESLEMGCVSYSQKYFPNGKLSRVRFRRARLAARSELRGLAHKLAAYEWSDAIGTSGTARAIGAILREFDASEQCISRSGMKALMQACIEAGHTDNLGLEGLSAKRAAVFSGGLAIMIEVFRQFDIASMSIAEGSLREGILYDLLGRYSDEDARIASVRAMSARYHVDELQASRVAETALQFFDQVAAELKLDIYEYRKLLEWSALLHEVGLDIAHSRYHVHGAYLLRHSDMSGFTQREQLILSVLVGQHRRKIKIDLINELPKENRKSVIWLVVILRLAVVLNRSRSNDDVPDVSMALKPDALVFSYPKGWLRKNPLLRADLSEERRYLKKLVGLKVRAQS